MFIFSGSLDSVCVTPLQASFDEGAELESNISQTIKMHGKTQEIIAQDFDDGSLFMGVRHDYGCCFLKNSAKVSKNLVTNVYLCFINFLFFQSTSLIYALEKRIQFNVSQLQFSFRKLSHRFCSVYVITFN